jgi:hypothetical protein
MSRNSRLNICILLLSFVFLSSATFSGYAQNEPVLTDDTATSPSVLPTASETATETATGLLTGTPTETAASVLTQTPAEAALTEPPTIESTTVNPSEVPTEAATEVNTTVLPVPTATSLPEAPPLSPYFADNFDMGDLSAWTLGAGWALAASEGGRALQVFNSDQPVRLQQIMLFSTEAQLRFRSSMGALRLSIRQSSIGDYTAVLASDGTVAVYRLGALWQTAKTTPGQPDRWRTMRLSAINGIVRVAVDGVELLALVDDVPLPPGSIAVSATFPNLPEDADPSQNILLVDDVLVSVPTTDLPLLPTTTAIPEEVVPTPRVMETATATPSPTHEPLPPEPPLTPVFTDNFDGGPSILWTLGQDWSYVPNEGGLALQNTVNNAPVTFANSDVLDAAVEARFQINAGAAQLSTRVSKAGQYTASLDVDGTVNLYRNETLLGFAAISSLALNDWHTLRLSAFGEIVHVNVDSIEVITVRDPQALPPGTVMITGLASDGGTLLVVEDFTLSIAGASLSTLPESDVQLLSAGDPPYYYAARVVETLWMDPRETDPNGQVIFTHADYILGPSDDLEAEIMNSADYSGEGVRNHACIVVAFDGTIQLTNDIIAAHAWQPQQSWEDMNMTIEVSDANLQCESSGWQFVTKQVPSPTKNWYGSTYTGNVRSVRIRVWSDANILRIPRRLYIDAVRLSGIFEPDPTLTPSPTPDFLCQGQISNPLTGSYDNVVLRDRAKTDPVQAGIVIDKLDPGEPVYLLDGYNPGDAWWWHIRGANNPSKDGYVHSSVVDNYNNCSLTVLIPPTPPVSQPGEMCFVDLPGGYEVTVYSGDNTSIRTITGPVDGIRVFGTSQDRSRFLISSPGDTLPQEWVNRGLFVSNPPNARACQDYALSRFHYSTHASQYPQEYWNAVGSYAHDFQAPISLTQYQNEYHLFRNSYPYINPGHEGTDVVYRPNGNSVPFMVYSQHTGVIVDAGPDGITRTLRYSRAYSTNNVPSNQFAGALGVFYWTQELGNGNTQVTYFFAVTGENDPDADKEAQRPSQDYYPFGLTQDEIDFKLKLSGFEADPGCNHNAGCSLGPGQRVIIWYNTLDDDSGATLRPEVATVYYHVAVDQIANYSNINTYCSRRIREETWNGAMGGDPNYAICLIAGVQQLGEASHIGFADAPHLHYEVYVDYDNDGQIELAPPTNEREDPLMAFATIR